MKDKEKDFLSQELARTMMQLKRISGPKSSWQGIRPSEFILLSALMHYAGVQTEGIKVSELSNIMQITPAGVTHLINSLEENGYVERLADANDRRVVLVRATEKSQEIHQMLHAKHMEFFKDLVEFLGSEDSKELVRLLSLTLSYVKEKRQDHDE